jgi:hypothetical protein
MQFSNDNFDELLKKAADDYPLRTDSGTWMSVSDRLGEIAAAAKTKRNRKWQLASFLLLILLGGGLFVVNNTSRNSSPALSVSKDQATKTPATKDAQVQQDIRRPATSPVQPASFQTHKKIDYSLKHFNEVAFLPQDEPATPATTEENRYSVEQPGQSNIDQSGQKIAPVIPQKQNTITGNQQQTVNTNSNQTKPVAENKKETKASDIPIKLHPATKTLYGTFFVAPQFSTVKSQHVDELGYKVGVSLGYRINHQFSVEIAVQRESKNFYSTGEYFDRSSLKLKETISIETLNGNAKVTDIPVSVRYNFRSRGSGHLFATAGVSAMLITHSEQYDYAVTKDGAPDNVSRNFGASTDTKYFSGFNASVGYEAPLGNTFKIRVEPYYQANLKGLGIGDLPVNSFGISFGISKDLK